MPCQAEELQHCMVSQTGGRLAQLALCSTQKQLIKAQRAISQRTKMQDMTIGIMWGDCDTKQKCGDKIPMQLIIRVLVVLIQSSFSYRVSLTSSRCFLKNL